MRELTKSISSFTWAMSLFGAKQMLNAMQPARATEAFDAVTRETEHQLDDTLRATFQAGDRIQRSLIDMTFGMLTFQAVDPSCWGQMASQMAGGATEAARQATAATGQVVRETARATTGSVADVARPRVPPPTQSAAAATPTGAGGAAAGAPGWGPLP